MRSIRSTNRRYRKALARLSPDELEERIYNQQYELIRSRFPNAKTNLGWAVTGDDTYLEVCTKVYGEAYLISEGYYLTGKIYHRWEDWS